MLVHAKQDLAQQIVNTVKDVCGKDVNFIDASGMIFASTQTSRLGTYHEIGRQVAQTGTTIEVMPEESFPGTQCGINMPVYHNNILVAVIGITGPPDEVRKYAHLAERITILLIREHELSELSRTQADKRQYIIDSLIQQEIANTAYLNAMLEQMQIDLNTPKRLILVRYAAESAPGNYSMMDHVMTNTFQNLGITLFSFHFPNEYRAVMDDAAYQKKAKEIQSFARKYQSSIKVAVGKPALIYHLNQSYQAALMAWKSIADTGQSFVLFDDMTLELVLSGISREAMEAFVHKTLARLSDKEQRILKAYFEEEGSLSRTSERLFIHKNTLQYQLNQMEQHCGLNPRNFHDSVLLYLAVVFQQRMEQPQKAAPERQERQ